LIVSHTRSVGKIVMVPVDELRPGDSPRLDGENEAHVQILAEAQDALPPIVVCRATMRVIDGMHRWRAAIERGEARIAVEFFDGSVADAFLCAVRANVSHGLPLSISDRKAAAKRIIASRADLSDRAIAAVVGLSPPTVGAVRRSSSDRSRQANTRVGRDRRVRPLSAGDGRRRVSEIIAARPGASLRELAREAKVSIGTAHDVRRRTGRGENPVPDRESGARPRPRGSAKRGGGVAAKVGPGAPTVEMLRRDPSLRFTDAGRALLQWMGVHAAHHDHERVVNAVPEHCVEITAELARQCAEAWTQLGNELERRTKERRMLTTPS
jgi:hypothetical protein